MGDLGRVRVLGLDRGEHARDVLHGPVDLAARRVAAQRRDQLRERTARSAEQVEDRHECGDSVVRHQRLREAEVHVARELAREDRAHLAHARLHEGVADPAHLGDAAGRLDLLRGDAARTQIVEHAAARVAAELPPREQRREQIGRDRLRLLVDEDGPVRVAVEGDAEVGAGAAHRLAYVAQVLDLEGIRFVVGKRAVRLEVEARDLERQALEQWLEPHSRHPVAAVDRNLQPRRRTADAQHVIDVAAPHVGALDAAAARRRRLARDAGGKLLDLLQAARLADRDGVLATELEAVVLGRIVGRGEHDPAAGAELLDAEVEHRRADQAEVDGGHALGGDTGQQRLEQLG